MKVLIQHEGPSGENCLLSLYPESRRAFLQVRKNQNELLQYKSSDPQFEEKVNQYLAIDVTKEENTPSKDLFGDERVDIVTLILHRI